VKAEAVAGLTPLASSAFRWLWCSSVAIALATGMERTATAWLALQVGGGALVGLMLAVRFLPPLVLGLAAGTIADRIDRPRQLVAVALAALPLAAAFGWFAASGRAEVWLLLLITFGLGCITVFDQPARQTLAMDTVPPAAASNAIALNALATRGFTAVGALLAGTVITSVDLASCYLLVAGACLLGAGMALGIRAPRAALHTSQPPFRQALRAAARLVVDVPAVRTLFIVGITCEVLGFSFMTAVPVVARDVLDAGAEGLGVLNAAVALGGAVSVLLLSLLPGRIAREPVLGGVFGLFGASLVAVATTKDLALASAGLAVTGGCAAAFDALEQTLIQLAVPGDQRGRAVGVWLLGLGSAPIGHVEMGALVTALGAPAGLLINGALVLGSAALLLARAPAYRSNRYRS
jgi:predicted MFS family arabinose efflux permease